MWSVIAFCDNSVEVVPSKWYDKGVCAWPKNNLRSFIDNQVSPNKRDFRFINNARKLGKDIDDFDTAQKKGNLARITSDLSTNESSQENNAKNKRFSLKRKACLEKKKEKNNLWSPASSDNFDDSDTDPHYVLPGSINDSQKISPVKQYHSEPRNLSNSSPYNNQTKRKLIFDKKSSSVSPSTTNKLKKIISHYQERKVSNPDNEVEIINTASSPFKVSYIKNTPDSSEMLSIKNVDTHSSETVQPIQNKQKYIMNNNNDLLEKVNRNVLNLKYDIKSLHEKIDKFEEFMNAMTNTNGMNQSNNNYDISEPFESVINNIFPLTSADAVQNFESLLLDPSFRSKIVLELSRYVRNTLPSTIRCIMRFLFKDSLLKNYSYKGQKGKIIFSNLGTCSIIFDAVKKMKKYQKFDKIDVEQPMRVFIAGAKFREKAVKDEELLA